MLDVNGLGEVAEDVKPSIEYLDSLNDYRKRSRSAELAGTERGPSKTPRLNGYDSPHSALPPESEPTMAVEAANRGMEMLDDPTVYGTFIFLSPIFEPFD